MKETEFENKYGVNVIRHPKTGTVVGISKKEKENLSDLEISNKGHGKNKSSSTEGLTKSAKRRQKKLAKLQADEVNIKEFDQYKDEVKFGEVVSRPPSLKPSRLIEKKKTLELRVCFSLKNLCCLLHIITSRIYENVCLKMIAFDLILFISSSIWK